MGKNQAYKAMQRSRVGSTSGGPDDVDDGMVCTLPYHIFSGFVVIFIVHSIQTKKHVNSWYDIVTNKSLVEDEKRQGVVTSLEPNSLFLFVRIAYFLAQ